MITITWGSDDKRILQYQFEGKWNVDDLLEALEAGFDVTQRYHHDIDVLVDLTASGIPNLLGMNIAQAFQKTMNRTQDRLVKSGKEPGMVVIVSTNGIIRGSLQTMLPLYSHMASSRIDVADTIADAKNKIAAFRQNAEDMPQSA